MRNILNNLCFFQLGFFDSKYAKMMEEAKEQENDSSVYNSTAQLAGWIVYCVFSRDRSLVLAMDLQTCTYLDKPGVNWRQPNHKVGVLTQI